MEGRLKPAPTIDLLKPAPTIGLLKPAATIGLLKTAATIGLLKPAYGRLAPTIGLYAVPDVLERAATS